MLPLKYSILIESRITFIYFFFTSFHCTHGYVNRYKQLTSVYCTYLSLFIFNRESTTSPYIWVNLIKGKFNFAVISLFCRYTHWMKKRWQKKKNVLKYLLNDVPNLQSYQNLLQQNQYTHMLVTFMLTTSGCLQRIYCVWSGLVLKPKRKFCSSKTQLTELKIVVSFYERSKTFKIFFVLPELQPPHPLNVILLFTPLA